MAGARGAGAGGRAPPSARDGMTENAFVVFTPSGKRGRFAIGTSVLDAARAIGVDLDSVCGGRGLCGRCQVEAGAGHFAKFGIESAPAHLSPPGEREARYASRRTLKAGRRLGCSAQIQGDLVIDVPPESQVHKQVVRKRAEARDYTTDPAIRLHYVEVAQPDMHNPRGDFERLADALSDQWGLSESRVRTCTSCRACNARSATAIGR